MKKQDYSNHVRYYAPHHFILYPILLALTIIGIVQIYKNPDRSIGWQFVTVLIVLLGWFSFMVRQHYALTLQNRIVRLELRVRYFQLTGKRLEPLEDHLSFRQIAALRFASDEELPVLLQKAVTEKMPSKAIKKSITNWLPDHMRV